jgi:hypothetical protein
MKTLTVVVLATGVIIGGYLFFSSSSTMSVVNEIKEVQTVEVTPDWAQDEDAVKAAQAVIRKKELEALEAQMVAEIRAKQAELDEVRKELGSY